MKEAYPEWKSYTQEKIWSVEGIPVLQASVRLPVPQTTKTLAERRIRRYYQLQSRAFLRRCETLLYQEARREYYAALSVSAPLPLFRADLDYRITWDSGGIRSLYTQLRESPCAGQYHLYRWGDTWDLQSSSPLPLQTFFPPRSPWKKQLLHLAADSITQQEATGTARYHEHWRRSLRKHFSSRRYYLSQGGLVFFYPMYSIAPAAEGIPCFCAPPGTAGLLLPGQRADAPAPTDMKTP